MEGSRPSSTASDITVRRQTPNRNWSDSVISLLSEGSGRRLLCNSSLGFADRESKRKAQIASCWSNDGRKLKENFQCAVNSTSRGTK